MIILISPAKKQYISKSPDNFTVPCSEPEFKQEALELIQECRQYSPEELQTLMKISPELANLNYQRFQNFQSEFNSNNSAPALSAFKGDVYNAMSPEDYSREEMQLASNQLRILSGLYGLLKPNDLIQLYRLEMSVKLSNPRGADLYKYWSDKITAKLDTELENHESKYIINLASSEYSDVVDRGELKGNIIDIDFKENRDGKLKTIGIIAKKARGMMTNYIITNKITSPEKLKQFDLDGYNFSEELSSENKWIFVR